MAENIAYLRKKNGMKHRRERLRERRFVPLREISDALGVSMLEIKRQAAKGMIETRAISDLNNLVYRCPGEGTNRHDRVSADEVQCAH